MLRRGKGGPVLTTTLGDTPLLELFLPRRNDVDGALMNKVPDSLGVTLQAADEAAWSNATHLLINDPQHPRFGTFLRGADLGWPVPPAAAGQARAAAARQESASPAPG